MPKRYKDSALQHVVLCLVCALLLIAGCQRRDAVIAGVDIPIPEKMTKNPDKVFDPVPGFKDGQASYQGKVAPTEILVSIRKSWRLKAGNPPLVFPTGKTRVPTQKRTGWF